MSGTPAVVTAQGGVSGAGPSRIPAGFTSTAADRALRAVLREGEARVDALTRQREGVADGPSRLDLDRRVEQAKSDALGNYLAALRSTSGWIAPASRTGIEVWASGGNPLGVGLETSPAAASDGAGGIIAAVEDRNYHTYSQIVLRHVDALGNDVWILPVFASSDTSIYKISPVVVSDASGGVLVAWIQNPSLTSGDIYLQHIRSDGTHDPGWPSTGRALCTAAGKRGGLDIVTDGGHGAIVAWHDWRSGNADIYVQHANSASVIDWTFNGLQVCAAAGDQTFPRLATDEGGGAYVVWQDARFSTSDIDIYAQRVTYPGTLYWGTPNGVSVCGSPGNQQFPAAAPDGFGRLLIAWEDSRGADKDIYAQRMGAGGGKDWTPTGQLVCGATGDQNSASIVASSGGGAIVAWQDRRNVNADVFAQRLGASGSPAWTADGIPVCAEAGDQDRPVLLADGSGGAFAAWTDHPGPASDIYAQHLLATGRLAYGTRGAPLCVVAGNQYDPLLVPGGAGGAVAAWSDGRFGAGAIRPYTVPLTALCDLDATVTPGGFSSPAVPRNLGDATVGSALLTPTLDGNTADTYLNWAITHLGPYPLQPWSSTVALDEAMYYGYGVADNNPPQTYDLLNAGPVTVRGGRHSLTIVADVEDSVSESSESNNVWRGQWVWSPLALAAGAPQVRPGPPNRGLFSEPNSDGFRFDGAPSYAWVVSAVGRTALEDYDLRVYGDYSGSSSGFSATLAASALAAYQVEFVVGHFTAPSTVYPAVFNFTAGAAGTADFVIDGAVATLHNSSAPLGQYLHQVLGPDRLADVYEFRMTAGVPYHFALVRETGSSTLGFSLYPATSGGVYGRTGSAAASTASDPAVATLDYIAPTTGWYPVVVFRSSAAGEAAEAQYDLFWNSTGPLAVPPGKEQAVLAFEGPATNPMRAGGAVRFSLSEAGTARLSVYDVQGRLVRRLADGRLDAGAHEIGWDGRDGGGRALASGLYFLRLEASGRVFTRRATLLH